MQHDLCRAVASRRKLCRETREIAARHGRARHEPGEEVRRSEAAPLCLPVGETREGVEAEPADDVAQPAR